MNHFVGAFLSVSLATKAAMPHPAGNKIDQKEQNRRND
jgi:hypothetical protein